MHPGGATPLSTAAHPSRRDEKMPDKHHPKRGSMGYSPRKRAKGHVARFSSWPDADGEPRIQGFAGYKAGMTHAFIRDYRKESTTAGQEVSIPVTIIEVPAMKVVAVRLYRMTNYGLETMTEFWTKKLDKELADRVMVPKKVQSLKKLDKVDKGEVEDVRVIAMTQPKLISGIPKKIPDVMELRISGSDIQERMDFAKGLVGKDISIGDFINEGQMIDVIAITKGKGFQGAPKRWGIKLLHHKDSKHRRKVGAMGPWKPPYTMREVPLAGQVGYHQRTEFNKRILRIGENGEEVNPDGGFLHYGEVRNPWVMVHGSVPGSAKRLVRFRDPARFKGEAVGEVDITYVSTASKQGA
jgi:large subunit ribosomal protein L3